MTEEYMYDRQRIFIVIFIIAIIISTGLILVAVWPKPPPEINDFQTSCLVLNDIDTISDKYTEIFDGIVDTNNTVVYKITIYASDFYFVERLSLSLQVSENVNIIGVAMTNFYDESVIIIGQNDIPTTQKIYIRTALVSAGQYIVYFFLDVFEENYIIDYNIRISD